MQPLFVLMRANAGPTAQPRAGVGLPSSQTPPAGLSPMIDKEQAGRARGSSVAPSMSAPDRATRTRLTTAACRMRRGATFSSPRQLPPSKSALGGHYVCPGSVTLDDDPVERAASTG